MVVEADAGASKLQARDWRLIGICVVVAVVSLAVARRYFHRAFPQASIDFQVSGTSSEPIAAGFLRARVLSVAGFRHAEQFGYDDTAKTFLERELGLTRADELLAHRIPLWRWQHRWFKPLDKEEMRVAVATSGAVVGFDHAIADDAPGASLTESQARGLAQQFLTQVMHQDWRQWSSLGAQRQVRAHRTDYVFTWKDTAPLVAGASGELAQAQHRHLVRIQGAEVGAYHEYVQVPETWLRSYAALRSQNQTAGLVDSLLLLVLGVGMVFILVMRIRGGDIRWRAAWWIGGAGAALDFLSQLNGFGAARFGYDTTQSWAAFIGSQLLGDLAAAVGVGLLLLVLTAAAETLYRERFPEHVAVSSFLSWRGVRSKSFLISMVLGLSLAAFFFAYQTVFYLIANHFGAWAPADVPFDNLLNTKLPWAFVLFSGFFPAISEEFGFRMLAIPLFEKWFRYLWVAVIAASFLWGFGHAAYPNEPWFIRGVEVGLGGVLLSWIMIRFGILATVVWHYTVDAFYTAMLLLGAHAAYLRWSGAVTAFLVVLPLLVAIVAYRYHRGFAPERELTNAAAGSATAQAAAAATLPPPEPAEPAEPPHVDYAPISGPSWTTGLIVAAALLSAFAVPVASWSRRLPWRTDKAQAIRSARQFLAAQGFPTLPGRVAVVPDSAAVAGHGLENVITADDLFRRGGQRLVIAAFSGPEPTVAGAYWDVRFYRPLDPEEFMVRVRSDSGAVVGFAHQLPETAPGASPPLGVAQAIAARFLVARGFPVQNMILRTAQQHRRPARTDTSLIWESEPGAAAAPGTSAPALRVEADLAGTSVAGFTAWYHVPEQQVRAFTRSTLLGTLLGVAKGLLYAAAGALIAGLLLLFARRRNLAWSSLLKLSAAAGVIMLIISALAVPLTAAAYLTAIPWQSFEVTLVTGVLVAGLGGFLGTLVLLAALSITAPAATVLTRANARRQLERESAWDALWVGLLSVAWVLGWGRVETVVQARWFQAGQPRFPSLPAGLAAAMPGLSDILGAPLHALWAAAALGVLLPVLWKAWRAPHDRKWAIAGIALMFVGSFPAIRSGEQLALAAIFGAVGLALLFGFGWLFLRESPLAYVSAVLLPLLAEPALVWFQVPLTSATTIGAVLLALAAAWVGWLAWVARRAHAPQPLVPRAAAQG